MLTVLGYALLAIVLVAGLFFLGATLLPAGEQLAPAVRDEPHWALSNGRAVSAEDVENVRLPVALRGYRFAETDELLDTLAAQIRWRDAELARLRAAAGRVDEAPVDPAAPGGVEDSTAWTRPADAADADAHRDAHDVAVATDDQVATPDHAEPRATE